MNKMHTLFKCILKTLKMDDILSPKGNPNKFQVVKIILTAEAIKVHLSQCTSPKHPVSCIEPGLATCFIHDILHVSMP